MAPAPRARCHVQAPASGWPTKYSSNRARSAPSVSGLPAQPQEAARRVCYNRLTTLRPATERSAVMGDKSPKNVRKAAKQKEAKKSAKTK